MSLSSESILEHVHDRAVVKAPGGKIVCTRCGARSDDGPCEPARANSAPFAAILAAIGTATAQKGVVIRAMLTGERAVEDGDHALVVADARADGSGRGGRVGELRHN